MNSVASLTISKFVGYPVRMEKPQWRLSGLRFQTLYLLPTQQTLVLVADEGAVEWGRPIIKANPHSFPFSNYSIALKRVSITDLAAEKSAEFLRECLLLALCEKNGQKQFIFQDCQGNGWSARGRILIERGDFQRLHIRFLIGKHFASRLPKEVRKRLPFNRSGAALKVFCSKKGFLISGQAGPILKGSWAKADFRFFCNSVIQMLY